jgi:hypothetical protein
MSAAAAAAAASAAAWLTAAAAAAVFNPAARMFEGFAAVPLSLCMGLISSP